MSLPDTPNVRKITKVVYLLLQRYHRTFGLSVIAWSKPPANHYFTFFSLALRDRKGRPLHIDDKTGNWPLTIYQDSVGMPAWTSGRQLACPGADQQELPTSQLLSWYEENLALDKLFKEYPERMALWRQSYHVSQSEAFLLTWNVLGLFASSRMSIITTYGRSGSPESASEEANAAIATLGSVKPFDSIDFCDGVAFASNGQLLIPDSTPLDLWDTYLGRGDPEDMADDLEAILIDPSLREFYGL